MPPRSSIRTKNCSRLVRRRCGLAHFSVEKISWAALRSYRAMRSAGASDLLLPIILFLARHGRRPRRFPPSCPRSPTSTSSSCPVDRAMGRRHLRASTMPTGLRCGHGPYCAGRPDRTAHRYQASAENGLVRSPERLGRFRRQTRHAEVAGDDGGPQAASPSLPRPRRRTPPRWSTIKPRSPSLS